MRTYAAIALLLVWLLGSGGALAGALGDRVAAFPAWSEQPPVAAPTADLHYPDWIAGTWRVTSTLTEAIAPLAPEVVTPGFEGNRESLDEPVAFRVRFVPQPRQLTRGLPFLRLQVPAATVVADRAFNGAEIARAYLGDRLLGVEVPPENPNRQVTRLASGQELVATVVGRAQETEPERFVATEVTQQVFRNRGVYLNTVEVTTDYRLLPSGAIAAVQFVAVFLSPQDPDYFRAGERPAALYRYRLQLERLE